MNLESRFRAFRTSNRKALTAKTKSYRFRSTKAKQVFSFFRWLHIYISCALFLLLIFFCVTGVTLNHPEWTAPTQTKLQTLELPSSIAFDAQGELKIKAIQSHIESNFTLSTPRNIDIALDIGEITFDYPLPSGYAFVTVILEEEVIELEHASNGFLGLMNDLHKGRHSGKLWSFLIDISAIFIIFFSLAGVVILLQNAKHRKQSFIVLVLGVITPIAIYLLAVPRL